MSVLSPRTQQYEIDGWELDHVDPGYQQTPAPAGYGGYGGYDPYDPYDEYDPEGPSPRVLIIVIGVAAALVTAVAALWLLMSGSDGDSTETVADPSGPATEIAEPVGSDLTLTPASDSEPVPLVVNASPNTATETTVPPSTEASTTTAPPTTVATTVTTATTAPPPTEAPATVEETTTVDTTETTVPSSTEASTTVEQTTTVATGETTTTMPSTSEPETTTETTAPTTVAPTAPPAEPATTDAGRQQAILDLVNVQRASAGCDAVSLNGQLNVAADAHSEDMAAQGYFDHTGLDGSQPWDRAADAGYGGGFIGENIAQGYSTAESVMNGWMNSPGHRANILNCRYTHLGVGYASGTRPHYWTQLFGAGG